ncbi:helix-turn-helix domain-containing protein [Roseibium sediminicola]|uniref:Helix-turn-helix transcriptional regulator n=1 Tax=Roseibium sediminicola TaxID=2933272 RepID=A0ABT0H3L4_9HYPH|nr:helix-turn-helix transcriptional regulator [Roseibium sp. CAU 1639]MCK7615673.1 helix-turn-helix transcriptional regulator [Roseibium sp. CAU 1639]
MSKAAKSFRDRMRAVRPDVVERQDRNARKQAIAKSLRALRDSRGLTQNDVARKSGMTQSVVARLEALTGSVPKLESIERYVSACGGHLALIISPEEIAPSLEPGQDLVFA